VRSPPTWLSTLCVPEPSSAGAPAADACAEAPLFDVVFDEIVTAPAAVMFRSE